MSRRFPKYILFIVCLLVWSCATAPNPPLQETPEQSLDAAASITGAIAGEEITAEDLIKLNKDLKSNPQAQEAVQSITDNLTDNKIIKYCPETGERFAAHLEYCPGSNVKLKVLEPNQ